MQLATPSGEPALISPKMRRFSSTERSRLLDGVRDMRSARICSTGVSSAYMWPFLIIISPRDRSCSK